MSDIYGAGIYLGSKVVICCEGCPVRATVIGIDTNSELVSCEIKEGREGPQNVGVVYRSPSVLVVISS